MKKVLLILAGILFLIASCDKEENNEMDILSSKTWKVGIEDKNPQSNPQGRILYYGWMECEKDDTYTFHKASKQVIINKGNNKCSSDELPEETFSFSIDKDKNQFTIGNQTYTIADFSNSQIKLYVPLSSATDYDYLVLLLQ